MAQENIIFKKKISDGVKIAGHTFC